MIKEHNKIKIIKINLKKNPALVQENQEKIHMIESIHIQNIINIPQKQKIGEIDILLHQIIHGVKTKMRNQKKIKMKKKMKKILIKKVSIKIFHLI